MNMCDLCQRTERQAKCRPAVIGCGENAFEIRWDERSCVAWRGHLCADCRKRVADSLRTLVPSPSPDAAPFATPTPKQAYVMQPSWPWVARFALGVLIGMVSMAAGAAMTLSLIRH